MNREWDDIIERWNDIVNKWKYQKKMIDYVAICALIYLAFFLVNQFTIYDISNIAVVLPPIITIIFAYGWYKYGMELDDQHGFLFFFMLWLVMFAWPNGGVYWRISNIISFLALVVFIFRVSK